ncbi:MAG: hypothetical protein IJI97_08250 [Clostridia bacterium]|nr:hypothetical protein [Clostridia bacterium]
MKRKGGGKKPIYKRPWFWVVVVVLILGLGGLGSQEEQAQDQAGAVTRAVPQSAGEEKGLNAEEPAPVAEPAPQPAPEPEPAPAPEPESKPAPAAPAPEVHDYILNTNTMRFHRPDCSSVKQMSDKNKQAYTGTREDLIAQGYDPCDNCNP